jgi:predicted nuclease of predicted toxin-antitoxin system
LRLSASKYPTELMCLHLVDEQINPRVAEALRRNGVTATSIHDLGLANQKFEDTSVLELAVQRQETLLTLDDDFLVHNEQWLKEGRTHFGIVWGQTAKYQHKGAIGIIVRYCTELDALIEGGAGTLEEDIYNKIHYLKE